MRILLLLLLFFLSPVFADNIAAAKINARLGLAYLSQGYYSQSKTVLLRAINEAPNLAATWYSMAFFLEKTGHFDAAARDYQKSISLAPHSGAAKNNYGAFLCRVKKYPEAIQQFLLAANEKNYLHSDTAYVNAGVCAMKIPDYGLAKKYFTMALDNNPRQMLALLFLKRINLRSR